MVLDALNIAADSIQKKDKKCFSYILGLKGSRNDFFIVILSSYYFIFNNL